MLSPNCPNSFFFFFKINEENSQHNIFTFPYNYKYPKPIIISIQNYPTKAMETTFFNTILFSSSLLIILLYQILKKKNSKTNPTNPPTPPSLPFLGHLHLFGKPLHRKLTDLAARLGPVISLRFGSRPVVVISSPELAELCLTAHGPSPIRRTDLLFSHCSRSAADIHADECRRVLRGLVRDAEAAAAEWSAGGAVKVEMSSRLFAMGVDVVMRMVAGKKYYGEEGVEGEEGRRVREAVEELFGRRKVSNVGELLPWLRWVDVVEAGQRLPRFGERMDGLLRELTGEEGEDAGERTLIGLLHSLQSEDPENFDDCFIKNIVMVSKFLIPL